MKTFLVFFLVLLVACGATEEDTTSEIPAAQSVETITIGFIEPLTGDAAIYGQPLQRVVQVTAKEINEEWAEKNMRLKVVYEDGKCTGIDALTSAQKLVNVDDVKVIHGGGCSGETLSMAPFTEENQVIIMSPLSSSPDITNAGDFVFRTYPSDTAQVAVLTTFIKKNGYKTVSLLSENTDYAQALRRGYQKSLPDIGVEIVADEVVSSDIRDVRTEATKILSKNPDAVILMPQTTQVGGIFAKQLFELGMEAQGLGNEILGLQDTIDLHADVLEGYYTPESVFEENEAFKKLEQEAACDLGFFCAAAYDALHVLADALEVCGEDTICIRDWLYDLEGWVGMTGPIDFDENGDVPGNFAVFHIVGGEKVLV